MLAKKSLEKEHHNTKNTVYVQGHCLNIITIQLIRQKWPSNSNYSSG